jgi:hypothetical protein
MNNIHKYLTLILVYFILQYNCLDQISPKFCINCKFFKPQYPLNNEFGKCKLFPIEIEDKSFLVTGLKKKNMNILIVQ